jgi:hypothetical protein
MPVLPDNTTLQYNRAAEDTPRAENQFAQPVATQMSEHFWDDNILASSQSTQFGLESAVLDRDKLTMMFWCQ